jgi:hypothetical protein
MKKPYIGYDTVEFSKDGKARFRELMTVKGINWPWIITGLSLIGVVLNILQLKICFAVWLITNAFWSIRNYRRGEKAQAFLFAVYFGLAVWGLVAWR